MDEALDVAVNAAARGELGECGWVSFPLPLPDHHLTGLPLGQYPLVSGCYSFIHLDLGNTQCCDEELAQRPFPWN